MGAPPRRPLRALLLALGAVLARAVPAGYAPLAQPLQCGVLASLSATPRGSGRPR